MLENSKFINQVSIDCVIFGFEENELKVLIPKINFSGDFYALPSGFIYQEEDIENAAKRILEERTGLKEIYMEQFKVFGKANRKRQEFMDELISKNYIDNIEEVKKNPGYAWFTNRFISIGYYALVNIKDVKPRLSAIDQSFQWYNIDQAPELIMDHPEVLKEALKALREDIDTKFNVFHLLPEKFTMREVQDAYETIFEKEFVRTNFQKKILSMDVLERLEKKFTGAKNKAPYLYRLKSE
ncbi:NUDIX hydrolase [Jiulongibacter sediminis]|uniref:NUDIX hydrolase n=1 Tax=Jiulongibacter sediminis TaxID=1605367 RepID=A0A0P7C4I1_9BACT|nr:NUDIX hydrolase [Jiulongibacter sediminis]TBX21712.1 NUDIX hydrolase [Jiulongibacter sediminis]